MQAIITHMRVVTYTRISKDQAGDAHGVANQLAALEKYAAERGWTITARKSDNDISAFSGKHRPGFDAVMALVDTGQVDVVLCWAVDRFVRRIADLEAVIGRFQNAGCKLAAVSGDLDLSSDAGRTVARMLSVIAQGEVERKAARQRLAAESAARAGQRRTACPRPFGYQADRVTPEPTEARAVADACSALLAGSTIAAITRDWRDRGLVTAQTGQPFTRQSVRQILSNPRIAALAVYKGEIIGQGEWTPLVAEETWRAVIAILDDPARKPPRGVRTLLGGLARCQCGNVVTGTQNALNQPVYRCNPLTRGDRPGPHGQQRVAQVDEYVTAVIIGRLARADVADLITPLPGTDVSALRTEAQAIRVRLESLAGDMIDGLISRSQLRAGTERANARLAEIDREIAEAAQESVLAPFASAENAKAVWDSLDLPRRRAVISALTPVILYPVGRGAKVFNPDTVALPGRQPIA